MDSKGWQIASLVALILGVAVDIFCIIELSAKSYLYGSLFTKNALTGLAVAASFTVLASAWVLAYRIAGLKGHM